MWLVDHFGTIDGTNLPEFDPNGDVAIETVGCEAKDFEAAIDVLASAFASSARILDCELEVELIANSRKFGHDDRKRHCAATETNRVIGRFEDNIIIEPTLPANLTPKTSSKRLVLIKDGFGVAMAATEHALQSGNCNDIGQRAARFSLDWVA